MATTIYNCNCKMPSDWIGSMTQDQHTPTVTRCVVDCQGLGMPGPCIVVW